MKSKKTSKAPEPAKTPKLEVKSLHFWRAVIKSLIPSEKDDQLIGEAAVELRLQSQLLADNWADINRVAGKCGDKVAIGWSFKADRSVTPTAVSVSGSFSEKHTMKAESDVPDPNQSELPGINEQTEIEPGAEPEDPPRVRAGVEGESEQ